MEEDHKGRIWFGTYTTELCYYENDSIYPYKYNDKLKDILVVKSAKMSLYVDENDKVYLGDAVQNLVSIDSAGNVDTLGGTRRNVFEIDGRILTSRRRNLHKGSNFIIGLNEIHFFRNGEKVAMDVTRQSEKLSSNLMGNHYAALWGEDSVILVQGNMIMTCFNGKVNWNTMDARADDLYIDQKKRIWVGTWNQGVKVYTDYHADSLLYSSLEGNTITHVIEDFQGGFWFSSLNNGIYHIPSFHAEKLSQDLPDKKIRDIISGPNGYQFVLYDNAEVWYIQGSNSGLISTFDEEEVRNSEAIFYDAPTSTLYLKGILHQSSFKDFKVRKIPDIDHTKPWSRSHFTFRLEEDIFDIRGKGIFKHEGDRSVYQAGKDLEYYRVQCFEYFHDTLWLGTLNGIHVMLGDSISAIDDRYKDERITAMESNEHFLVFSAENRGLVIKSERGTEELNDDHLLSSAKVMDLAIDSLGRILIGTTHGLYYAEYANDKWILSKLNPQQADVQQPIYSVLCDHDDLFLGTDKGLVKLKLNILDKKVNPPLCLIEIRRVNGHPVQLHSSNVLEYDQNSLEIAFTAIDYSESKDLIYAWKFNRQNEDWILTKNPKIYLDQLQAGNYEILMKASSSPGTWSDVSTLKFRIEPPFWMTWYFIGISFFSLAGIIVLIVFLRIRKLKKEAALEVKLMREKNELEIKALRAQMNPHFIFNTLTAIQYLIQNKDNQKAMHFLIKFSQLLRRVTDTSQDSRINLKEELDILQTYVDLQNLRFQDKFHYEVNIPRDLNVDEILIPGLILQPFVENAIQHGLSKKEGKGKLTIDITRNNGQLKFTITDDGIGRKKSKETKLYTQAGARSVGISNVSSRLNIINFENKERSGSVQVTDLFDENHNARGTMVEVNVKFETGGLQLGYDEEVV